MRCGGCAHENRDGARFCAQCGGALQSGCAKCGAPLPFEAHFCDRCGTAVAAPQERAEEPPERVAAPSGQRAQPERRQLSVLFCDLVGSTELAGSMDPEDWRDLVEAYQHAAGNVIFRFGGHVAQYLGDGILAYFGWPAAHEDDAERAVRAGLGIVEVVQLLKLNVLHVRVGIHTGPVVVSEMGDTGHTEVMALGDTMQIAARVQGVAETDTVVITPATHRLVAGQVVVDEPRAERLKGVPEPVLVYRVRALSGVRGRLQAAAQRGLTPHVGREHERRLLLERWEEVQEGRGQVVVLGGEPGIGKSRLVQQFKLDLGVMPHTWIECGGSPFFTQTPFHPVSELLQQGFAWARGLSEAERLAALEHSLGAIRLERAEAVSLIAPLLGLTPPLAESELQLTPEQQRRKLLATLVEWVLASARLQSTVIVTEDLQWVDPSTLELMTLLVDQCATVPLFLLYTARPEFRVPWPLRSHHAHLTLGRLSRSQVRTLVETLGRAAGLQAETIDRVVARTDGVPLFVEELTKAVVETSEDALREIPATLQDSLMARLDRLGDSKKVAQTAAVLGREFTYPLLHAVSPLPDDELQAALRKLLDADLVHASGMAPDAVYVFKHALVQETAYASLLRSHRRELHHHVAQVIEREFRETVESQPEVLARHWTDGGATEPAIAAWRRAAERARSRSAFSEAVSHYTRALELLETLADSSSRKQDELQLQLALGSAMWATKGWSSPEAATAFGRARELGTQLGDTGQIVFVLLGTFVGSHAMGELQRAQRIADEMLEAATVDGTPATLVWAHFAQGTARHDRGDLIGAWEHLERGLAMLRQAGDDQFPNSSRVGHLMMGAFTAVRLGLADRARALENEALEFTRGQGQPYDLGLALLTAMIVRTELCEPEAAGGHADELIRLGEEHRLPGYIGFGRVGRGWSWAHLGRSAEGPAEIRQGLRDLANTGTRVGPRQYLGLLAEAYLAGGAFSEGLAAIDEAFETTPEQEVAIPFLLCVRGDLERAQGVHPAKSEASYRAAIDIAHRQGAKAMELRVTTRLARLLQRQGRADEALGLLAPAYAALAEGFDTRGLVEAKALLDELAAFASQREGAA